MDISKRLLWGLYAGGLSAMTTVVAAKLVNKAWAAVTGDVPPDPNDPEVPLRRALTWALASGVGIGLSQLLANRLAADHWAKSTGTPAPRFGKTTLKL